MKRIIFSLLIFLFICYFFIAGNHPCKNIDAQIYKLNNKKYCLLTANNQRQWEKGLMFYKKPVDFDGMIFIFPEKEVRNFWNKNTYVDLNLYWMDDDKVVGKSFLPSILKSKEIITVGSGKKVDRVVEIIF
jgi:uncharacterized membrane protein (UPF0127 family)